MCPLAPDPRPCVSSFTVSAFPIFLSERTSSLSAPYVPFSPIISLPDRSRSLHASIPRPVYLSRRSVSPKAHVRAPKIPEPGDAPASASSEPAAKSKEASPSSPNATEDTPRRPSKDPPFSSTRYPPRQALQRCRLRLNIELSFTLETKDSGSETIDFSWTGTSVDSLKYETTLTPRAAPPPDPSEVAEVLAYKKVENRVKPVATTLPEHFRIERRTPSDPLAELPHLPHHPPPYSPGERYTAERKKA